MRRIVCAVAVLAASACSTGSAPVAPSGVDPRSPSLSGSQPLRVTALQENCTLTQGFWKNHEDAWPVEELLLGNVTYTKAEVLEILGTPPRGDATYILVHQLIAAKLNVAAGADPAAVETGLADADAWLAEHPLGSKPRRGDRQAGLDLATQLDDYNNGVVGPGHCDATPLPSPSPRPSPTPDPGG
jgi:hypothetical protein